MTDHGPEPELTVTLSASFRPVFLVIPSSFHTSRFVSDGVCCSHRRRLVLPVRRILRDQAPTSEGEGEEGARQGFYQGTNLP